MLSRASKRLVTRDEIFLAPIGLRHMAVANDAITARSPTDITTMAIMTSIERESAFAVSACPNCTILFCVIVVPRSARQLAEPGAIRECGQLLPTP